MANKGSSNSGQVSQQNTQMVQYRPSVAGSVPIKVWLYVIGVPLLIGGGYFLVYKPLKKFITGTSGAEDSAYDRVNDISTRQAWWGRSYYLTVNNGIKPLTDSRAKMYADELHDSMHGGVDWWDLGLGTDEPQAYGTIRQIGSKAGISQVAEKYYNTRHRDLLEDLRSELKPKELYRVNQIISTFK